MNGRRHLWPLLVLLLALTLAACQQGPGLADHLEPLSEGDALEHAPGRSGEIKTLTLTGPDGEPFTFAYEVIDGLVIFEGDMIIGTEEEFAALEGADGITVQSTLLYSRVCWEFIFIELHCENYRWPSAIIPFTFLDDWDDPARTGDENAEMHAAIEEAMAEVERVTAIRFVPRTTQGDYIRFRNSSGCSATVGRESGAQDVRLAFVCRHKWVIVHELMHTLGFKHEQTRHDRNSHVQIVWDNILDDKKHNFETSDQAYDYGPYDYDSLMHYGVFDFCRKNSAGECVGQTIVVPSGDTVGQRSRLSVRDIASANRAYPGEPPTVTITSPAGGTSHVRSYGGLLLTADTFDPEGKEVTVTWWSDRNGLVGYGSTTFANAMSMDYGPHVITARAVDPQGNLATATVGVTILNEAPTIAVLTPLTGTYCSGEAITFRALVYDRNETGLTLPDSAVSWTDGAGAPFATGKTALGTFLALGPLQVTVRATDSQGAFDEDSVVLTISDCSDQPPTVTISEPADQSLFFYDGFDDDRGMWFSDVSFVGSALDQEDGALSGSSLVWTTDQTGLQAAQLGTGTSITARLYSNVCAGVTHNVTLAATDSFGNTRTALVRVGIYTIC